jgi:hypothetical protein
MHANPVVGFNQKRAGWAREALLTFMAATGLGEEDGHDTAIGDLLADLMHLTTELEFDFQELLAMAERHHVEETSSTCTVCRRSHDAEADGSEPSLCIECSDSRESN